MVNYSLIAAFTGNIIAFVAGSALTWSSPTIAKLNVANVDDSPLGRNITSDESSWIGSLVALGATFGPFLFGYLADKIGRKYTLLILGCPFLVAYLLLAFAQDIALYYVARVIIGIAVGGVFTVIPMYIGEIAEAKNRGALGSVFNVFICLGLFFSYCVGPYISILAFNVILAVFPGIFMVVFFFLAPESPHYYFSKNRPDDAEISLNKLRGASNPKNVKELEEIKDSIEKAGSGSILDIFRSKGLLKAQLISLALVGFQQFSGINVVLFYAQNIFEESGSGMGSDVSSIVIGGVQFGTSFVTPLLADRLGRKMLLIFSAAGMIISEIPLGIYFYLKDDGSDVSGISWLPIVSLVLYIITYNCGFGPLPWAVMGELFPANVKSIASSLTAGFCWLLGFIITKFFQSVADSIGMGPSFWMFAGFCVLALLFSIFFLIETKGKNVDEIQAILS